MTVVRVRGATLLLLLLAAAAVAATTTQATLFSSPGSDYYEAEEGDHYEDEEPRNIPMNVSALGPTELLVSWHFESNATSSFEVAWSPANDVAKSNATTNNTSYNITNLTPCTSYTVHVLAVGANDTVTGSSANETATTARQTSDVAAVAVDAVASNSSLLDVSWWTQEDPGNCSSSFNVTWGRLQDGTEGEALTACTEYTIGDLEPFTPYNVCVTSFSDANGQLVCGVNRTVEDAPVPNSDNSWIVAVSVTAAVLLVAAAGVAMYVFRNKLRRLNPRLRSPSLRSRPRHGVTSPRFREAIAATAAGEVGTTDLRRYIKRLEEDTQRGLEEEFEFLRQRSTQHPALAAVDPSNKSKNRFRNILPFDHSRVILPLLAGDPSSDYINANYILDCGGRRLFVACQGPTSGTMGDFWRLVWHVDAQVVVMLTNLRERGRERCALYWPTPEEPSVSGGDVTVSWRGEAGSNDLRVREFMLQKGKKQRPVTQYHHTTWPDFGVPIHEHHLLDLLSAVRSATPQDGSPVVVHCSAGVGRTGTFIGLWNLMDMMDAGQLSSINVRQTVLEMRECRPNMVQTPEQYLYLYKCIAAYLEQPTRWRRKTDLELPGAPAEDSCQDYIFAYENPTFSKEGPDCGT